MSVGHVYAIKYGDSAPDHEQSGEGFLVIVSTIDNIVWGIPITGYYTRTENEVKTIYPCDFSVLSLSAFANERLTTPTEQVERVSGEDLNFYRATFLDSLFTLTTTLNNILSVDYNVNNVGDEVNNGNMGPKRAIVIGKRQIMSTTFFVVVPILSNPSQYSIPISGGRKWLPRDSYVRVDQMKCIANVPKRVKGNMNNQAKSEPVEAEIAQQIKDMIMRLYSEE